MLFIFGVRPRAARLAVVMLLCPSCHTPAAQVIRRLQRWLTVFFIPLVPLGITYDMTCTMCASTVSLSPRQAGRYVGAASAQQEAASPSTPVQPQSSLGTIPRPLPPAPSSEPDPSA